MQALTQLAGIAKLGQRCSCTALSIINAIIQRHLPSDSWMPFLQEVQITSLHSIMGTPALTLLVPVTHGYWRMSRGHLVLFCNGPA